MRYTDPTVVKQQKKHLQVNLVVQKEAPSSKENSTPPIGAPKAAATPAAAPQDTKSRFSLSFRKSCTLLKEASKPIPWEPPCDTAAATPDPIWIMGPSLPSGKPALHEKMIPMALQRTVLILTRRGMFSPLRKHLISGMPDPEAKGSMYTDTQAKVANNKLQHSRNKKAAPNGSCPVFSWSIMALKVRYLKLVKNRVKYVTNNAQAPTQKPVSSVRDHRRTSNTRAKVHQCPRSSACLCIWWCLQASLSSGSN